ncbi:MAG: serine/threonine-protein kinase [Labilithrix sp.]
MTAGAQTQPAGSSGVAVGTILAGKYRVEKVLGEGGMGVVVAATHLQLDEPVALKFLHGHLARQTDLVTRFQREAKAARKIKSEHVVKILDVGELENGAPFMVMEYLAGTDLDALVRGYGRLSIPDAVDYVLQACEALAEAHVQGMVHRDLKPANLFISRRADETPLVKVLDFGISKVTGKDGVDLGVTKTNAAVLGSPLYMAPEQMRSLREVDARTDVWALGVILQEIMTGAPPFNATTLPELCATILQDPPQPLRALRPEAPEGLEAAIMRCLQKDPAARYPDVAAFAMDLYPFASLAGRASAERVFGVYRAAGVPRASNPPSAIESARTMAVDPTGPRLPIAVITPRVGIATTGKVWSSGDSVPAPVTSPPPPRSNALMVALLVMVSILTTLVVVFVVVPKLRSSVTREVAAAPPEPPALAAPPAPPPPPVVSVAATPARPRPSRPRPARPAPARRRAGSPGTLRRRRPRRRRRPTARFPTPTTPTADTGNPNASSDSRRRLHRGLRALAPRARGLRGATADEAAMHLRERRGGEAEEEGLAARLASVAPPLRERGVPAHRA